MEEREIHLILMDVMMPHMDGIRATAKLRESKNIPIIFLTAKSEDADKILGLNIGADDYVTKPFTPLELMARVNSQLRRYTRFLNKNGRPGSEATSMWWAGLGTERGYGGTVCGRGESKADSHGSLKFFSF